MRSEQLQAAGERLIQLDDRVCRVFRPYATSPAFQALDALSKLGDQPALRMFAGILMVAGTFAGNNRLVRAGARMMIAHEVATMTKDLVKTEIDRTRPRSASSPQEKKLKKGRHTSKEETSFPSGHSAGAIAAARAFSREFPEVAPAAMSAAGFLAFLQIPRCAHYPSDVAAGVVIGLAAEAAIDAGWTAARMDECSTD